MPSGNVWMAIMNPSVIPAVARPSKAQIPRAARLKRCLQGLAMATMITAAQARRNHPAPSGPIVPASVAAAASPSCTQPMAANAIMEPIPAALAVGAGVVEGLMVSK
ncbi:hypothetical protein GCM10009628_15600 [Paeniglutamicibacter kerguelensis]